jgi:hypothetical protein
VSVRIDGVDLSTLGLITADVPELRDGVERDYPLGKVPGRGAVHLSRRGQPRERRITVVGAIAAADHATVLTAMDSLKRRVGAREVQIVVADALTRYFTGRPESIRLPTIAPTLSQRMVHVRWTWVCTDPLAYDTTPQSVAFGAATQMPLGSAPSRPVLTLSVPAGDVAVIYRDSGGTERGRIELVDVSGAELVIDCDDQVITFDDESGAELLSGGDFLELDPLDGAEGGPYPTLEVVGTVTAAVAVYRRAWL